MFLNLLPARTTPRRGRWTAGPLRAALLAIMFALSVAAPAPAQAPDPATPSPPASSAAAAFDAAKTTLDQAEAMLERQLSEAELTNVRNRLDPVREALVAAIAQVEPRLAEARDRLNQLGPKPADGAPAETPEARQNRDEQTRTVAELDARVKALKVQQVRVDQLVERITDRRRQLFTAQLFERSVPIVDPRFWLQLSDALPRLGRSARFLAEDWWHHLVDVAGTSRIAVAFGLGLIAAIVLVSLYRQLHRYGLYGNPADVPASRLARVKAAIRTTLERALVLPVLVGIPLLIVQNFDLVLPRAAPIPGAVFFAVLIVSVTRGVMQGVMAPGAPAYRLIELPDAFAEAVFASVRAAAWAIAVGLVSLAFAQVVIAPVAVTAFITGLTAIAIAVIIFLFLRRTTERHHDSEDGGVPEVQPATTKQPWAWTRPALWMALAAIAIALVAGFTALAAFLASRIAAAVVIAALTVMILVFLDAIIAEWFGPTTVRGRSLSAAIGIRPDRLDLIGTLFGGVLHIVVLIASALVVFGPWGFGGGGASLEDAFFGVRFGEIRSLAMTILGAGLVLAIGLLALRAVMTWFRDKVLPRTGMDSGLQNSVGTIVGYAGFALVASLGLRQIGLDLSNITIIAGALSVGIGFGLQSIVQNFVSGLILLAERPIRVGDSIVVKGEEGHVRKISVRSTEIETFDRATVILPNAELITGVVKNWTLSNTLSRITIPVRVAYDSDPDLVRDQMIAAACDNRFIIQDPPPRVFLMRFGDNGLEFELRGVVTNVEYSLTTRSELQLSILSRFRQHGIIIAPPVQTVQTALDPPAAAAPEPEPPPAAEVPATRRQPKPKA
ncbi:MAG: transmembrane protein [Xanthobacteraceae bacterium]|nr:MAG: transmembrane protein [Xanthobacteraceae bacterium]